MQFRKPAYLVALVLSMAVPMAAQAFESSLGSLSVVQDSDREPLTEYGHNGKIYVAGERGQAYSLQLRNPTNLPVLAVVSVDGVNVLDGKTASYAGAGYVIPAYGTAEIKGWRKSLSEVARFNFSGTDQSYATRTGRAANVGVIGAALFRMKTPPPPGLRRSESFESSSADQMGALAPSSSRVEQKQSIGTGHGPREQSQVSTVEFERASSRPDEVLTVRYDTHRALVAKGVILEAAEPSAFPVEPRRQRHFVPDPG